MLAANKERKERKETGGQHQALMNDDAIFQRLNVSEVGVFICVDLFFQLKPALEKVRCAALVTMVMRPGKNSTSVVTLKTQSEVSFSYLPNHKWCFIAQVSVGAADVLHTCFHVSPQRTMTDVCVDEQVASN